MLADRGRRPPAGHVVVCVVVGGELIDQLRHAHAALDRRIVLEGRAAGSASAAARARGAPGARRARPRAPRASRALPLRAEHADVDASRARRSGDVSTPVTVTKPIRGSFSSGSASESTSRTDSLTRRIRSAHGPTISSAVHESHVLASIGSGARIVGARRRPRLAARPGGAQPASAACLRLRGRRARSPLGGTIIAIRPRGGASSRSACRRAAVD